MTTEAVRVVIVEDNETFRSTLELLFGLRDEVVVVGSAASGDDAPELCRRLDPDVVLMDYRMPGLNGADATRAVLAAAPRSRVVCLTASVTKDEVDEVFAAGAVACVTKDEDFDRLIGVIREAEPLSGAHVDTVQLRVAARDGDGAGGDRFGGVAHRGRVLVDGQ